MFHKLISQGLIMTGKDQVGCTGPDVTSGTGLIGLLFDSYFVVNHILL